MGSKCSGIRGLLYVAGISRKNIGNCVYSAQGILERINAHNPEVDWTLPQVVFTHCPASCTLSQKPLVITSRKMQTRATTINVIQPSQEVPDIVDAMFSQEAMENFLYMHSFAKYDHLAI